MVTSCWWVAVCKCPQESVGMTLKLELFVLAQREIVTCLNLLPEQRRVRLLSTDWHELALWNDGAWKMQVQPTRSRQPVQGGKDREGNNTDNDLNEWLQHPVELTFLSPWLVLSSWVNWRIEGALQNSFQDKSTSVSSGYTEGCLPAFPTVALT